MKKLLLIIISVFTLNSCAQEKSINLIESALMNLKIEKIECLTEFIVEQKISESESIIVIPEIAEKREGYIVLNSHILIINNKNGNVKSRFSEKGSWFSDAVRLEKIEVVYQPFKISKDSETIGILIDYYGSSRSNPYSSKELTLFLRNGEKLERILKDYSIQRLNGETDGMNSGIFIKHKKTIEPNINSKTEFFNLKVTDSIIKTESTDGTEKIIEKSEKIEKLKYENGKYKNVL